MPSRRFKQLPNDRLNLNDLAQLRKRLTSLSYDEVLMEYKALVTVISRPELRIPSPRAMQELIQTWRQLRRMRLRP